MRTGEDDTRWWQSMSLGMCTHEDDIMEVEVMGEPRVVHTRRRWPGGDSDQRAAGRIGEEERW